GMLGDGAAEQQHDTWIGRSKNRRDILILRDPLNLFASRLKCSAGSINWRTAVRMWKQHAREFLGRRSYLPNNPVFISYRAWVSRNDSRREAAETLGLAFNDRSFDSGAESAGGSSFDGLKFRRRASSMRVFDRWKQFAADSSYRQLFDP